VSTDPEKLKFNLIATSDTSPLLLFALALYDQFYHSSDFLDQLAKSSFQLKTYRINLNQSIQARFKAIAIYSHKLPPSGLYELAG
jgi:hypothetical protein